MVVKLQSYERVIQRKFRKNIMDTNKSLNSISLKESFLSTYFVTF